MDKINLQEYWGQVPYLTRLGATIASADVETVRLNLPYKDENSNMGGMLHGGVAASLINLSARMAAQMSQQMDPKECEITVVDQDVQYLSAAISEPIDAVATVLRKGKELSFISVDILKGDNKFVARGSVTVRTGPTSAKKVANPGELTPAQLGIETFTAGDMGKLLTQQGFIGDLGMDVQHMESGYSVACMNTQDKLEDGHGNLQDGAVAALIDTTGAMAAWSMVELGMHRASTPALHVNFMQPSNGENITAVGRNRWQRDELFLNEVWVMGQQSNRVIATGNVVYRIVVSG